MTSSVEGLPAVGGLRVARAGLNRPVAAIDVGSNSVRIAIVIADGAGLLEVIEEASATPKLIRDVQRDGRLSDASINEVVEILRDFQAVARGADADPVVAVATSAVRDAANGADLAKRIEAALGIRMRIVDGGDEARLAFLGAIHSLPVEHGLVIDIGGGSMEIMQFAGRAAGRSWTLPLGAVRLTAQFLQSDPPSQPELRALRDHLAAQIAGAGIEPLAPGGALVGTGGTIRNIAKMDRSRHRYPMSRLHGYAISQDGVRGVADLVRTRTQAERYNLSGLNEDRADSIVAGALVLQAIVEATRAHSLMVSGQGLREGIALEARGGSLPSVHALREASIERAVLRFAPTYVQDARARTQTVEALASAANFTATPEVVGALSAAATLLDLGRSVDYYNRHRHTEALTLAYGLPGWTHREVALICAIVRQADSEKYDPTNDYRPLITADDRSSIAAAGTLLAVADEVERRVPPRARAVAWRQDESVVRGVLRIDGALLGTLSGRFERTLGLGLASA